LDHKPKTKHQPNEGSIRLSVGAMGEGSTGYNLTPSASDVVTHWCEMFIHNKDCEQSGW